MLYSPYLGALNPDRSPITRDKKMTPTSFPEQNFVFTAPENMPECGNLPAFLHQGGVLSCWEISDEELEVIAKTKRIWVNMSTHTIPPTSISVEIPFQDPVDFPTEIDDPEKS